MGLSEKQMPLWLSISNQPHHAQSKAVSCLFCNRGNERFDIMARSVHKLRVTSDKMCQSCQVHWTDKLKGKFCERLAFGQPQVSAAALLDTTNIGLGEDHQLKEAQSLSDMTMAREEIRGKRKLNDNQSESPRNTLLLGNNGKSTSIEVSAIMNESPPAHDPHWNIGVHFNKKTNGWEANLRLPRVLIPGHQRPGFQIFLGVYETKDEAKDARDRTALKLRDTKGVTPTLNLLNFPESRHTSYMEAHKDWSFRDFVWHFRRSDKRFARGLSSMKGVRMFVTRRHVTYSASINRMYSDQRKGDYALGTYAT